MERRCSEVGGAQKGGGVLLEGRGGGRGGRGYNWRSRRDGRRGGGSSYVDCQPLP